MITDPTFVGLVAACCTAPDDDNPRGILADWLDDYADSTTDPDAARAWAAHIRWSIAAQYSRDEEPEGLLDIINLGGWFGVGAGHGQPMTLSRGFPSHVEMHYHAWASHGSELSWHPSEWEKDQRPCPPTACPGVEVTIRGPNPFPADGPHGGVYGFRKWLKHHWPGVKNWHTPDAVTTVRDYQEALTDEIFREISRRYRHLGPQALEPRGYAHARAEATVFRDSFVGRPVVSVPPGSLTKPDTE